MIKLIGKKIIAIALVVSLFGMGMNMGLAYANETDITQQQSALDEINKQREELKKEIDSGKKVVSSLNKEIKNLESNIAMTQLEINQLSGSISLTEGKINEALAELDKLQADIDKQNQELGLRLRSMYKNGSVSYIEVLLGSSGITEFMTNLDRVQRIYESDKQVLETLQEEQKLIQTKRQYLEGLQASLEQNKQEQANKKAGLSENQKQVAVKKNDVVQDVKALEEQENVLIAEANALTAEILKLQGKGDYIGGIMMWPAPGVSKITSGFGNRLHPILNYKKLHTGIDIGCKSGTSIVAANAGTVIKAAWNNSYGNMVMVDHGGGIVTLYAHNSSLLVKTGDVVSMGQAIASSGSTGMSTGPHLHFEVRVNGKYVDPLGYVKAK